MNMKLSKWLVALGLASALVPAVNASTDTYPSKPITIIVPFGAGGTTDVMGRALAESLSQQLNQPVVIENRPGAGAALGVLDVMNAKPDGYRLTMVPGGIFRQPYVQETRYDPIRDLTYIASFFTYDFALTVRKDSPFKTVQDLVDYARNNPGDLDFGSTGRFTTNHATIAMLSKDQDISVTHVPYKGDSDLIAAVLGGHVQAAVVSNSVLTHLRSDVVRVLATADVKPNPEFGGVDTLSNLGYDVIMPSPLGVAGPAGMPKHVIEILDKAIEAAIEDPSIQAVVEQFGVRTLYMNSEDYSEFAHARFADEKDLVAALILDD